jgi:hypothetical protein
MTARRLLEVQPDGLVEWFHFDHATGEIAIEHAQDVELVIEANKASANDHDGFSASRELREIAEIPAVIALKWLNELGVNVFDRNHWPAVKRLLRDPDWRWLRTSPGGI